MANWYYYDNFGIKQGLVTQNELTSLVQQGIITPQTKLETESGQEGLAGQVSGLFPSSPADQQPQYGEPSYLPPPAARPPKDYLIWSIITTLCCCLPLGIIGIIFSIQAKSAFQIGDYAGYESKTKTAFMCNLIGLIVGSLIVILQGFTVLLPAILNAVNSVNP